MRARVTVIALALFVAVDVLLVAIAFRHVQSSPASSSSPSSSSAAATTAPSTSAARASAGDDPSASSSASSSSSGTAEPSPRGKPVAFVAVGADRVMLRASRGECSGQPPEVTVSTDAGKSFTPSSVRGLSEVLGVRAVSSRNITVLGLDDTCGRSRWLSIDGGDSWSRTPGPTATWTMGRLNSPATIGSPQGPRNPACKPMAVSTVNGSLLRLLCADGRILGTNDVGGTWIELGRLPGAVDIRFTTPGDGLALARRKGCPAAVMKSSDGGSTWERVGCVPGSTPHALGSQGDVVAAQVSGELSVSTDGGKTWQGPSAG